MKDRTTRFGIPRPKKLHQGFLIEETLCKRLHEARVVTGLSLTTLLHNALRLYLPTVEEPKQ